MKNLIPPDKIKAAQRIIKKFHAKIIFRIIGPEALTEEELALVPKGTKRADTHEQAYKYGRTLARGEAKESQPLKTTSTKFETKLPEASQASLGNAQTEASSWLRKLGEKVASQFISIVSDADRRWRSKMLSTVGDTLKESIERKKSIGEIKTALGQNVGEWTKDWERIAVTEKVRAMNQGVADQYREEFGDPFVFVRPGPEACPQCKKHYLGSDGFPKIFLLSKLEANGTNVGRKQREWQPVVPPQHPSCGCVLVRIPPGWGFDEDGDIVPGGEFGKLQKSVAFVGPRGGMWADAAHTIPWKDDAPHGVSRSTGRLGLPKVKEAQVRELASKLTAGAKETKEGLVKLASMHGKSLLVSTGGRNITIEVQKHPDEKSTYFGKIQLDKKKPREAKIIVFVPPDGTTKRESVEQVMRMILAHEITHAADLTLQLGTVRKKKVPQMKVDAKTYLNQPAELSAHMREVYRDLHDLQATKDSGKGKSIAAWATENSPTWKRIVADLSPPNRKKALKLIAGWWENQQAGIHETILKGVSSELVGSAHPDGATNTDVGSADTMSWFEDMFEFAQPPVVQWDYSEWLRNVEPDSNYRRETPETYTRLLEYDTSPTIYAEELGKIAEESAKNARTDVKGHWERMMNQVDQIRSGNKPLYHNPNAARSKTKFVIKNPKN